MAVLVMISMISVEDFQTSNLYVVYFYGGDWCPPCKAMKPVWDNKNVREELKNYKGRREWGISIDDRSNDEYIKRYKITCVPTVIIVTSEGKILKRHEGFMSSNDLVGFLKTVEKNE